MSWMLTYQITSSPAEPTGDDPIDPFTLHYMAGVTRNRIHQLILEAFIESGLTKAQLAKRLGMDKSRLSKLLNTSSNVTAETLGQVLFAIDGGCLKASRDYPLRAPKANQTEPVWYAECLDSAFVRLSNAPKSHVNEPAAGPSQDTHRSGPFTVYAMGRENA
jgi:transcriptional regulator with XRE-family HTH domain